ncbi:hypothetical protein EXW29_30950 (plasmid) [Bacillus toyonensis]|nr:hypothetical protein EXW29_30950 [Bacillus toyonensis]QWI35660.1 hypothetical protein EXW25_30930 [Bacillus toyonensis]
MFGVYQYMKLPVFQESALPLYDSPLQQISTVFAHVDICTSSHLHIYTFTHLHIYTCVKIHYKLIAKNKNELNDICATIGTFIILAKKTPSSRNAK